MVHLGFEKKMETIIQGFGIGECKGKLTWKNVYHWGYVGSIVEINSSVPYELKG